MTDPKEINDFIDTLAGEDHCTIYGGKKYFFEGCCCTWDENHNIISAQLEIYSMPEWNLVYSATASSVAECIEQLMKDVLFDGKTFYELVPDLIWTDDWT